MPAEEPFVIIAQLSTIFYFSFFIIMTPLIGWLENKLLFSTTTIKNTKKAQGGFLFMKKSRKKGTKIFQLYFLS
jgi:hypothetical protein